MSSFRPKPREALLALVMVGVLWVAVSPGDSGSLLAADNGVAASGRSQDAGTRPAAEKGLQLATPSRLRVGLATDLEELSLPCCDGDLIAESNGRVVAQVSSLRVEPGAEIKTPAVYRLQAAALKDESQAKGLATQLGSRFGLPSDVVFDAGIDLYRVRVGRFSTRQEAEAGQRKLVAGGLSGAWIVSEQAELGSAELRVTLGKKLYHSPGRWLTVRSESGNGIRFQNTRYRGDLLVYLNDRGLLNVINELPLEEYLRGVVPREMGPGEYGQIEALKAQSVAARTYTLKNLGEFQAEGYDICATPRCQVYGGMSVEHPLSDRAIAETSGEVLVWNQELVEALYSSTCGGHTENVNVIFPQKDVPYLKGVTCLEAGVDRIPSRMPRGTEFPSGLLDQLMPPSGATLSEQVVGARLEHLALLAGLPIPRDRLASLERREVQRFIASIFDLALDARLFVSPEDLPYLLDDPPATWSEEDLQLAAYLMKSGLLAGDLNEPLTAAEVDETLYRLAIYLRVVEKVEARYLGLAGGQLQVRLTEEDASYVVGDRLATFRHVGARTVSSSLALLAGDWMELFLHGDQLLAVVHQVETAGATYDRSSKRSSWTRFRSDAKLTELVNDRYPGLGFQGLEILERGVSGRVGSMKVLGDGGRSEIVVGLAVRWTLDVPDTLFTAKRLTPPDRSPGWLFTGRGWGHGVGMCQVGAFGMAIRGHSYQDILRHYYTGVDIVRTSPSGAVR